MSDVKTVKKPGSGLVRKMGSTIFMVKAGGTTTEFTDKYSDAVSSYHDAVTLPKELWKMESGAVKLIGLTPLV
jgi:hypothetical protein